MSTIGPFPYNTVIDRNYYSPFGKILFFLAHVTFGIGFPDALHSNFTGAPFFTCKCPPDVT